MEGWGKGRRGTGDEGEKKKEEERRIKEKYETKKEEESYGGGKVGLGNTMRQRKWEAKLKRREKAV